MHTQPLGELTFGQGQGTYIFCSLKTFEVLLPYINVIYILNLLKILYFNVAVAVGK